MNQLLKSLLTGPGTKTRCAPTMKTKIKKAFFRQLWRPDLRIVFPLIRGTRKLKRLILELELNCFHN